MEMQILDVKEGGGMIQLGLARPTKIYNDMITPNNSFYGHDIFILARKGGAELPPVQGALSSI